MRKIPGAAQHGFTMIELLMVIVIIAALSAAAVPQFVDFRNEARAAALQNNLVALRVGLKNQTQNALISCGIESPATWRSAGGHTFYENLISNAIFNDITYWQDFPVAKICTRDQVPDANQRKFFDIGSSGRAFEWFGGVVGARYFLPENPFYHSGEGDLVPYYIGIVYGTTTSEITTTGGRCPLVNQIKNDFAELYHWIYILDTGEIFPGSNTNGISECNL
jgi:prepilin-type N-terminal cleavage/methylation domain-containing protein